MNLSVKNLCKTTCNWVTSSLILVCVFTCFPVYAYALEISYPQMPGADKTPGQCLELASELQLGCFVKYIYSVALTSSGIICFAVILFGGVLYLISGTSIEKVKLAKAKIYGAFLGVSFLLVSYLILNMLNPQLLILSAKKELFPAPPLPPPLPLIEEQSFSYVEIPLGWLIERVKTRTQITESQAIVVNDFVSEQDTPGHATIKELAQCLLEKLVPLCNCAMPSICDFVGAQCKGQCLQDPCDKTISSNICRNYDVPVLNTHLRTAMNNIATKIKEADSKIDKEKQTFEKVNKALKIEKQKLELAEYLMTNSQPPPSSHHDIADYLTEAPKTLDIWETIDPAGIEALPEKKHNDPAHFYVDISEQHNKSLINIIESMAFSSTGLNPDWEPPPAPDLPTDPEAVILEMPGFLQTDPKWATIQINGCNDKIGVRSPPCESFAGCGCGPTSLAMILTYFLYPDKTVKPDEIATQLRENIEYFCGVGTSTSGLAQLAKNYGLEFTQISFNALQANIRNGKPVMAACHHFGLGYNADWEHISVIKGVENEYVYFQDTVGGEAVFNKQTVQNNFDCSHFYAFSKPR